MSPYTGHEIATCLAATAQPGSSCPNKMPGFHTTEHSMKSAALQTDEVISVLHVEKDAVYVQLVQEMLSRTGPVQYEIQPVSTLAQGLRRLKEAVLDVVLLELLLPDSRGLEAVFKFNQVAPQLPLIVLTEADEEDTTVQAFREGAQDCLSKSTTTSLELSIALRSAIERQRLMNRAAELQERVFRAERDRTAMETARAAADEIVPPLTTLSELLEKIAAEPDARETDRLLQLGRHTLRMILGRVNRLKQVYRYVPTTNARGERKVDIQAASLSVPP
jgi:DNA-binding NarL/FixJ family response regulator